MLTKILLTLSLIFSITGCKSSLKTFPKWPKDVKHQYFVAFDHEEGLVHCFQIPILSTDPYILGEPIEVDALQCHGVGGYQARDSKLVINFSDQVGPWVRKHCK